MMEILTKLIIIFAITIIYVQGEIFFEKIWDDSGKMAEIYGNYTQKSPKNTIVDIYRTQCDILTYCCSDLFSQIFDILSNDTLEEKCINHPELSSDRDKKFCSQAITILNQIKKSSEYGRFLKIHSEVPGSDQLIRNWRSQMKKSCDADALTIYYYAPDYMKYFRECQAHVLLSIAKQNGGKNYDAFVRNWINNFTTLNKRIVKEFPPSN
ncbi:unnamed protein product [Adineta steineri]|uniref:Uncharacterized protein n=1 Tax=Adineta steineri TaxID=433720 RepID=A0A813VQN5_9BILA|nr:unnamed protein product [Adineta steineri]CAF0849348.1 unnamed protein product [Adineta steineri]